MFKDRIKFLGLCILTSSILITGAIVFNAFMNRYTMIYPSDGIKITFDRLTGTYYYKYGSDYSKRNDIEEIHIKKPIPTEVK